MVSKGKLSENKKWLFLAGFAEFLTSFSGAITATVNSVDAAMSFQ